MSKNNPHPRFTLMVVGEHNNADRTTVATAMNGNCHIVRVSGRHGTAEMLAKQPPNLILCEAELPDGSWHDILNLAQEHPAQPAVVVSSIHADEQLWAEALNLGAYDVLPKPLEFKEVSRVLNPAKFMPSSDTTKAVSAC